MKCLIWWTNHKDCTEIGKNIDSFHVPEYLKKEYRSRVEWTGKGRLWIPQHLNDVVDPWLITLFSKTLEDYSGIVFNSKDFDIVKIFPGRIITNLKLKKPPSLPLPPPNVLIREGSTKERPVV